MVSLALRSSTSAAAMARVVSNLVKIGMDTLSETLPAKSEGFTSNSLLRSSPKEERPKLDDSERVGQRRALCELRADWRTASAASAARTRGLSSMARPTRPPMSRSAGSNGSGSCCATSRATREGSPIALLRASRPLSWSPRARVTATRCVSSSNSVARRSDRPIATSSNRALAASTSRSRAARSSISTPSRAFCRWATRNCRCTSARMVLSSLSAVRRSTRAWARACPTA